VTDHHPFRAAVEARDLTALVDTLAPDVVFHSPLISAPFEGKQQVGELFRVLSEEILFRDELVYMHELTSGDTTVLAFRTEVKGKPVEGVDVMLHDGAGKVRDITVLLRPFTGLAAVAGVLSPRIAGRGNKAKERVASAGLRPLAALMRLFDAIGSREVSRGS
jgi:hypothetical protein